MEPGDGNGSGCFSSGPATSLVTKEMSVEEYDLVILGGGTGSTVAPWTFAAPGQRVAVIERSTSADRVRTLRACRARTSFIAPRSHLTFEGVKSSAFPRENSASTCTLFANANAAWCRVECRVSGQLQKERSGIHPRCRSPCSQDCRILPCATRS